MAAKKQKKPGINLLKGLSGSKLMQLASLVIVVLAIPLTVLMLKQQQNTQQEAASLCATRGGTCINTDFQNNVKRCFSSGRTLVKGLCPGASNIQCCVKPTPTPNLKTCSGRNGICLDFNVYSCNAYISGLCPGPNNIKCCIGNYYRK